jgi:hypothetical protein
MRFWGVKETWLFAGALVVGALLLFLILLPEAGVDTTPTDSDVEIIVASEPKHDNCPDGWFGDVAADDEAHLAQSTCQRAGWIVYLSSEGRFAFAWDGKSDSFEYDSSKVKDWK